MLTRNKAKNSVAIVEREESSDSDSLYTDSVDMAEEPGTQASDSSAQIAQLVASIASLRECVVELRNETSRGQQEIQQLRQQVENNATNTTTHDNVQSTPPHSSTQRPQPETPLPAPYNGVLTFMENSAAKLFPLPTFDGNPEDWPLFLANYTDTTNEFNYNNRQNLMRLHKALEGNAKRAVTSLLIYPDDVPKVIKELEFNFGRPDLLIRSQLTKVQQFPNIQENRLDQVLEFSNRVRNIAAFFKSARCEHHLMNPTLLEQLVGKLPPSKQYEWSKHAAKVLPFPTVETFSDWISELAKVVAFMPGVADISLRASQGTTAQGRQIVDSANRHITSNRTNTRRFLHSSEALPEYDQRQQHLFCVLCNQSHILTECHQFQLLNTNDKWVLVKRHRLCFGCLRKGHNLTTCRSKSICTINGCDRMHHQTLHQTNNSATPAEQVSGQLPATQTEHVLNCHQKYQSSLFKILPVTLSGPHGSLSVYAMFDEGSSISLLEEGIATKLGLRGQSMPLTLQWYGEEPITENSKSVGVNIRGKNGKLDFSLKNVRTIKHLDLPRQTFCKEKYSHLHTSPVESYNDAKPVILLGLDNSFLTIASEVIDDGPNKPIAAATKLGWVAFGPLHFETDPKPRVLLVRENKTLKQLNKLVEEYFSIENFGVRSTDTILESDENIRARKILSETVKNIGQRYEVGLLWRSDGIVLPKSYAMAKQRLLNIEKRMAKDIDFAVSYKKEIAKYIDKGYAKQLTPEEASDEIGPTTWYLPHFGVVNPAATSDVSLNSVLLKGPEHAQPLISIIHKFRQGVIAVAGDIQEMFSQIRIKDNDQNSQRFLWRDGNPGEPIRVYRMSSLIFGAVCSPCCAEHIKNINAERLKSIMPRGAKAVIENTYVDDLVISFSSIEEAVEVTNEAIKINQAAGFKLRNFVSNCKQLQGRLNGNDFAKVDVLNMERKPKTDKILGMFWNTVEDTFEFHFGFHKVPRDVLNCNRPPTKREMLGIAMAIYDPFGFLANATIFMKLLLQSMWRLRIQWDEQLPHQLALQWLQWWNSFKRVNDFSVQRCYSNLLPAAEEIQLHIFVDASSSAYAAVAYLRIKKGDNIELAFVCAKSRCAPLKGMTVPRLELQAAILGCRMKTSIEECHDFPIHSTTFWSDSKTVILWIRSTTREYKQFVAYRISEILATTSPTEWRWIPTALNVADDATRAKGTPEFESHSRWIFGPTFLKQEEIHWPQEMQHLFSEHCAQEELPKRVMIVTTKDSIFDFTRYSTYTKIVRVTAWILRFTSGLKSKVHRKDELCAKELNDAERAVLRLIQLEAYAEDIEALNKKQRLSKSSSLYQLTPFIDDDGLLKVNGRIDAAYCLPVTARRPVILPQHHYVTRLIMDHHHCKKHHQNDNLTINELRQRFWVPSARALLKYVKSKCPVCICNNAKPAAPLMGQLPRDRLTPFVRPFTYSGVDYCGPFFVAIGRRREKRWVALFTCLTTRAIHLEVAEDLSTDAFLICLRNFVNRRGLPIRIRSDNGTNFIGAQKELKAEARLFDFDSIEREMAQRNIEWMFNCPANPSAGGCWERLVQCVKRLLQRVLKEEAPRMETFRSVLIEAENIVNSRPLTDLPITPEEEEPLTPNHFLLGCLNSTQTPNPEEEKVCLRKQWRIAQNLKDRLWKRWTIEYLPQLLRRSKWRDAVTPLQVGQLVIVCDPGISRSNWEKGRITQVFAAKDGQVQSAELRTSHGLIRRPACKLAALKFSESPHGSTVGWNVGEP